MDKIKNEIFNDIKKAKNITIVGLSILGNNNFKTEVKENLFNFLLENKKTALFIGVSDNQLFQYSLLTDTAIENRISFQELKNRRDYIFKEADKCNQISKNSQIKISSLQIPFFCIIVDDNIWYLPSIKFDISDYKKINRNDKFYDLIKDFVDELSNKETIGKYVSKRNVELLELFDQNKVPRGIIPRDSFYNTDHYQYVIWGLVFNREGKLLIHKRSANAKDNQDMWDKSVGGHIDFNIERSTHEAAVRELIEELYTKEKKQQTGHSFSMLSEDIEKVYYLGDWRIENFGSDYLNQIKLIEENKERGEENWVFYKSPKTITHNTPRIMPQNKSERWLRVIVDSFIFITNTAINDTYLKKFENSKYLLVEPHQLKTWMDTGKDNMGRKFKITPDLKYIMTGSFRDLIDEVSLAIKFSDIRK